MINNMKEFIPINISNLNLRLSIYLTYNCNYNCSYCCNKNLMNNSKLNDEFLNFNYIQDLHKKINKKIKNYELKLTGGEPSLYPDLNKLLDLFNDKTIILYTNGSMDLIKYEYYIKNNPNLGYHISYHNEFGNIDKYIELIDLFKKLSFNKYKISILSNDLNNSIYNKIIQYTKNVYTNILSNNYNYIDNNYSYKIIFDNNEEKIINESDMDNYYFKYKNIFKNFKCQVNKFNWAILPNGNYNLNCGINSIYNNYNIKDFNIFYGLLYNKKYLICNSEECSCSSFWRYKKWK